jgi:phage repressor protein C with HTH and peptisase S24 domain
MDENQNIGLRISELVDHFANGVNTKFAELVGTSEANIRNYRNGKMPKYDFIYNVCSVFEINYEWLITGKGEMLKQQKKESPQSEKLKIASESMAKHADEKKNNIITIPIIEIYAAAGHGYMNTDSLIPTGEINLPKAMLHSNGLRYCIRIKGHSMAPTLQDNDFLVIRHLDPGEWWSMSDEHVYLIVDKDGMAYVKRVKNRFRKGFIVLMSDSIEKRDYPNFNLQTDEIANIFYAEWHFSAKMQNINETYYDRLKSLEDRFETLENRINITNK